MRTWRNQDEFAMLGIMGLGLVMLISLWLSPSLFCVLLLVFALVIAWILGGFETTSR